MQSNTRAERENEAGHESVFNLRLKNKKKKVGGRAEAVLSPGHDEGNNTDKRLETLLA